MVKLINENYGEKLVMILGYNFMEELKVSETPLMDYGLA